MTWLEIGGIRLRLGETDVLDDISLRVGQGEVVSILGPSGAGKSSLFRLLTGAVSAHSGVVRFEGQPLNPGAPVFAFMPQRDALMPWRRIIDNVTVGLEIQGLTRRAARDKVAPLFPAFGLDGFQRHYPAELSGGMRQRAAFLRTIVQDRPVLLLDEPFGALDALTRVRLQEWLEARWLRARWTILLVTHDVREAVALSDRIYVLSDRPARVVDEIAVDTPRPRFARAPTDAVRRLEADLLATLFTQAGDDP